MSTLRYKDKVSGEWRDLQVIKGKSAYEYAVDGGYEGTEEEFTDYISSVGGIYIGDEETPPDGTNIWFEDEGNVDFSIENSLTSDSTTNALSAKQGKVLNETKADKTQISNRNLLDNPWFTINQRGVTSFSNGYGIDRWIANYGTIEILSSNEVKMIIGDDNLCTLAQKLETSFYDFLHDKALTMSVMLSDGTIMSGTNVFNKNTRTLFITSNGICLDYEPGYPAIRIIINLADRPMVTIKAVKLEVGSISTLHLDVPPNYAEELLKCQRYYYRLNTYNAEHAALVLAWNTSLAVCRLPLPCSMRSNPNVVMNDFKLQSTSDVKYEITGKYTYLKNDQSSILMNLNSSGLTTGSMLLLAATSDNAYIEFSADL